MVSRLTVAIISQCIQISNYYAVYLKLITMLYTNYSSVKKKADLQLSGINDNTAKKKKKKKILKEACLSA